MAWRGEWGASSSSPVAPRRQAKWGDPNAFNANAAACTVGTAQAKATASTLRTGSDVAAPRISARRDGSRASVRYRFERPSDTRGIRPTTLLVSVARAGEPYHATARRVRVRRRAGVVSLRLPPATDAPYVVSASAFWQRGSRSRTIRAPLP